MLRLEYKSFVYLVYFVSIVSRLFYLYIIRGTIGILFFNGGRFELRFGFEERTVVSYCSSLASYTL